MTLYETVFEAAMRKTVHVLTQSKLKWGRTTFPWKCEIKDGDCCIL